MSCENLSIPKPLTQQCYTNLFGIPYAAAGRTVAGVTHPISAIVLHCYDGTIGELCNEMKCRTSSSVISGSYENSFHYGIGAAAGSGGFQQFVNDTDISWTFGTYKNNTYATVPPPNIAINWPVLQGEFGVNTTPDVYTIDIALAIGHITAATALSGCYNCPTASGLQQTQHDMLVQMLAYLVQEYNLPIDQDHIQFHDLIHCGEGQECPCTDIETLLAEVAAFCPPCEQEAWVAPVAESNDDIQYIYGVTEACCPTSPGCLNLLPWNGCFLGEMAVDGTLDSYILGLSQDPVTNQWCLTRGCLAVLNPIQGCGTVDDPLGINLCAFGAWVPTQAPGDLITLLGIDAGGCLIQAEMGDLVIANETPFTGVDTTTILWTAGGVNGHAPMANVQVSQVAGNQIEIMPDGLYANIDCADLIAATAAGEVETIIGVDGTGTCVNQDVTAMLERELCLFPEQMTAEPTWLFGKTNAECPVFVTPESVIIAGLEISDTTTIDLTLVNNLLTANAIISPDANNILVDNNGLYVPDVTVSGGFCVHMNYDPVTRNINSELIVAPHLPDNIFQCVPGAPGASGAYVPDLTVTDTNCVNLTYTGRNLTADVIVSPAGDNVLTCIANGLYVEAGAGLAVADTDCLDLSLIGGVLSGIITLAPTQGLLPNMAQCIAGQGLYVPQGAGLAVTDTDCIDLTITNGVLSASVTVNPSGDNQLSCGPGGLYVPSASGLIANDTDCVNHSLVGGVLSTTLNIAGPQGGVPNILACIAGQGLYVPESHITVVDTTCIDLDFTGGVLRADIIIDPTGDNQIQCLPAGLYVPPSAGIIAADTDCITLNLAGDVLTSTPILAPTQAGIPNALECLASGLYVPACKFVITDDIGTLQFVNCEDIVTFDGINGATVRITATDTVTIDGHQLCAGGPPLTNPPYDTDQAWSYYDSVNSILYNWNCGAMQWETPAHITNAVAPPDATTCDDNTTINGVTEGVWTPGISTYTIQAAAGQSNVRRSYILTEDCVWAKVAGSANDLITNENPQPGIVEGINQVINLNNVATNTIGGATPPTITLEEDGCYEIDGAAILEYNGIDFESALARLVLFVNGAPVRNIQDYSMMSLIRPPGNPVTITLGGSTTICLGANDVISLAVNFSTNFGGQVYNILPGGFLNVVLTV